jgi:autotransporter-associated beta strand protein
MNIGSQFQGANGSGSGEVSIVTVSGGTMNVGSGSGPLYVASRGTGTLTVSGTGIVNCGKLDISRNAAGNSISSAGTVNLDGGTLMATSITNISANQQTGGSPTATFNFNGGTLAAKSGAAAGFFQGSVVAPVTPIMTFVKIGGAIIDDGGNNITIYEPLQHDGTLGGAADGGLMKLNGGTLTLAATNTYTGNTTVTAGTLALGANGSISGSGTISVNAGATLDASGRSDGTLTLTNGQTLAGYGTVKGNVIVGNGAALAPGGNGIGAITNTALLTLNAGGSYVIAVQNTTSGQGTGWDFTQIGGRLDAQATSGNPFVIKLQSFADGQLGAVTNFDYDTNYDWPIATTGGGVTNFDAAKFAMDVSQFQNDLAGGYFYARTNGNSLVLSFTNNHPPVAGTVAIYRTGTSMAIPIANLSSNWSDPDGDPVALADVNPSSTNGANNVSADDINIYYTNANNVADAIFYTVEDVRTNPPAIYQPGDTQRTAIGEIIILPPPAISNISINGNSLIFGGAGGINGGTYYLLTSTNLALPLTNWTIISTNAFDANGRFNFTNPANPGSPQTFYMLMLQ